MEPYKIDSPIIPSGQVYAFSTIHGVEYEVRFARKELNIFHTSVAFGVLNEEYEGDEYVLTNKGDVLKVMNTIAEIISIYLKMHPKTQVFEFNGILKEGEIDKQSQRTKLYLRYIPQIFDKSKWEIKLTGNKISCFKLNRTV
jgi:hypothetical protein